MAGSNTKRRKPRRIPNPGEESDTRCIAWYLYDKCGLTAQQLGTLVGCSPPTIYRVMNGKTSQDGVCRHLDSIWSLLSGSSRFGDEIAAASLEDRIRIIQRMARQTPSERIWENGLHEVALAQLEQLRSSAPAA